jgi:transcriptional regulator with XRE-family HTH domain
VTTNTEIVAIAETLRLTRNKAGLTQAELAEFIGVDRFVVARLESGRATTQVRQLIEALAALGLELTVVPKSRRLAVGDLGKPSEVESSMRIGSS